MSPYFFAKIYGKVSYSTANAVLDKQKIRNIRLGEPKAQDLEPKAALHFQKARVLHCFESRCRE